MRVRILFILIVCSFIFGCNSGSRPATILSPTKMKAVLWDVIRAQYLAIQIGNKDSLVNVAAETKALTQKVFKIHNIDSVQYNKSYQWYLSHPEKLNVIFDSLYAQKQRQVRDRYGQGVVDDPEIKLIPIDE